jgi:hypothetical protein
MSTTTKGVPFPAATDPDNVPGDLQALANWVDGRPGIAAMTTTARNALVAPDLWAGRIIFNITTGQLEQNASGTAGAANWAPAESAVTAWTTWTPATLPNGTTSVQDARFKQVGKTVMFRITFSSSPSFTANSGFNFSLPVAAPDNGAAFACVDASNVAALACQVHQTDLTKGAFKTASLSTAVVIISGTYEAA